jgi:hypothetical protein
MKRLPVRLLTAAAVLALLVGPNVTPGARAITPADDTTQTPSKPCVSNALAETVQGRAPLADYASGRAAQGYMCNATEVAHMGSPTNGEGASGGFRVHRYVDPAGHVCAYYDTTLLFPANAQTLAATHEAQGVFVLDMSDPANPVKTDTLVTPAMQSPHESLSLNAERGLLGAVLSNPVTHPGNFELYDLTQDCRHPVLAAALPMGVLGHEGSFAPDGKTYYSTSLFAHTLVAIDVSEIHAPRTVWISPQWSIHGLNISDDGNTLYAADTGNSGSPFGSATKGLTVIDVSEIQSRQLNPQAHEVSHLTWTWVSTPQTNLPITIGGHPYLVQVDEYGSGANVGAGRIIDIADGASHPSVVSNLRLAVHNSEHRNDGSQANDPGASTSLQGYAGHYCAVPQEADPGIVACSYIASGLRVFDIHDPANPVEIAYFNKPNTQASRRSAGLLGAYAMSQPAFDVANHRVWYTDGNSGFYVVQIDPSVWS